MNDLDFIKSHINENLKIFEDKFRDSMKSSVPLLEKITTYIVKRKGKQIRPMFVFLAAKTGGEINESTYRAAALIELLHTATLVHDDVVDDSNERRGFFSVNALWKNKIAVLIGDYLLSRGLLLSLDNDDFHLLKIVSHAVREMSEGELLQIEKARKLDITEETYFEIIRKKTAVLIEACCACGIASVSSNKEWISKMAEFGSHTGIAFQLKDDLFDFGNNADIGKPTGIDIKEKKMTLPLIFSLNSSTGYDKRRIINMVKNHHDDPAVVSEIIQFVHDKNGIAYAEKKMFEYRDLALNSLNHFSNTGPKEALEKLVHYSINRTK